MKQEKTTLSDVKIKIMDIGDSPIFKGIIVIILLIISIIICKYSGIYSKPYYSDENYRILEQVVDSNFIVEDKMLYIKDLKDCKIKYSVENTNSGYNISLSRESYNVNVKIVNGEKIVNRLNSKEVYLFLQYSCKIFIAPLLAAAMFILLEIVWIIIYLFFLIIDAISKLFAKKFKTN